MMKQPWDKFPNCVEYNSEDVGTSFYAYKDTLFYAYKDPLM